MSIPRILAVDDDEPILELIDAYLPAYEVKKVKSGADAISAFDTFRPNLVLLDISMPDLDGIETMKRLRSRPRGAMCSYMMLTAHADTPTVNRARDAGAGAYLLKPFERPKLVARIDQMLGRGEVFAIE